MTMKNLRRRIARMLCPHMAAEADRLQEIRADIEHTKRYLGFFYPQVSIVLDRIVSNDVAKAMADGTRIIVSNRHNDDWPVEIGAFRRAMFDAHPVIDEAAKAVIIKA